MKINTYLWIIKISKVKSIFWINKLIGKIEIKFLIKIPNKIKYPEIKFANSRIDNVQGRIINLISSIIIIKFIKNA